jgi:UDP-3-O-[3-hydroxymyristoyl] glucosamine N-acyltransferase
MKYFLPIKFEELLFICDPCQFVGDKSVIINNVATISDCIDGSLSFFSSSLKGNEEHLRKANASVIIMPNDVSLKPKDQQLFILVSNPRLIYIKLLRKIFDEISEGFIHPTALISANSNIEKNVIIGPYSVIGECYIANGTIIDSHCKIGDGTRIGRNVRIASGVVIGTDGFGYELDESGSWLKFPHIGGVVIEDNVEIGANTCIDRGTLGDTIIKSGAKIDNLVHIAHNVVVGSNAMIIANSMIGGSTIIGNNTWVAPSSAIRDALVIGSNSLIGLGAVVTKSVGDSEVWAGNPAKRFDTK